jgi:hypothetical protein
MKSSKGQKYNPVNEQNLASVRAPISFPSGVYQTLEEIALGKKVSPAWVVRDPAKHYIAEKMLLLRNSPR